MFTSDINAADKKSLKHIAVCIGCALFLALFGAVYEHFSYGVYSNFMIYAFTPPLIAGMLLLLALLCGKPPQERTLFLLHCASAACTAGCLVTGIVRVSGRTHALLPVFAVLGGVLLILALVSYWKEEAIPPEA
ncbi:MAG: hypothetical protein IKH27_01825 [Oscillospiraceae bacterium]|nr:hypothetical protein [Oscillospiraceae bacterium]